MIYRFGDFELDTRVYELRKGGTSHPVEPQVFDVLTYLVDHRDRVVPKQELLEKLWPDRFVSEATLTSRLKEARKAIGDTGRTQSLIRTHHGRGYRFVGDVQTTADTTSEVPSDAEIARPSVAAHALVEPSVTAPFVGRENELGELHSAMARAMVGSRQIVFVTGEAGAGKTTLVDTFLRAAASGELRSTRGQCLEHRGTGEPYLPLIDAIERLTRGPGGDVVSDLISRAAPAWVEQLPSVFRLGCGPSPEVSGGGPSARMLREISRVLEILASAAPLVLVLEDLHWSDHSTIDVLDLLARRNDPAQLLVIGTYRPGDVKASRHPVYALTQELRVRGQCSVVAVPSLRTADVQQLVTLRFGGATFENDLTTLLQQRTSGNPLFVKSLIDSWIAQRKIVATSDGWALATTLEELSGMLPETLQQMLDQQLATLSDAEQKALETASVAGREFSAAAVGAGMGIGEEEVEALCEPLARDGRFLTSGGREEWPDGTFAQRYAFTHDVYVDVLYDRIPAATRAAVHDALAVRFEAAWQSREREHATELAYHFARGRSPFRSVRYFRLAAEHALSRSAHHEAVDHLQAGLACLRNMPHTGEMLTAELALRSMLAPSLVPIRGYADPDVEQNYVRARELAARLGDADAWSSCTYGLATLYEFRGQFHESERLMHERLGSEPGPRARLESHQLLACSYIHQGRHRECVEQADLAIDALEQTERQDLDLVLALESHGWAAGALLFAGSPDAALERARLALELSEGVKDEFGRASAVVQAGFVHFYRRESSEVRQFAERAIALGREHRFPFHVGVGRILRGWCLAGDGWEMDAVSEIRAGLRTCRAVGARLDDPTFLAILAEVLIRFGRAAEADEALEEALDIVRGTRSFFYEPEIHRLRGVLCRAMEEDECRAAENFRVALDSALHQEAAFLALRAAVSLARMPGTDGEEGKGRLAEVAATFRDGFETIDFIEARELLAS